MYPTYPAYPTYPTLMITPPPPRRVNEKERVVVVADSILVCRKYSAIKNRGQADEQVCSSERNFCSNCSTMLWLWDHHWPELIHPFASAIDTELPAPDEMTCIMAGSKPAWVRWPEGKKVVHDVYGEESLEGWHKKHNLFYA